MMTGRNLRRFIAAAAISVAAHAALLGGGWLTPPDTPPPAPELTATLQPRAEAPRPAAPAAVAAPAAPAPLTRPATTEAAAPALPTITEAATPAAAPAVIETPAGPVVVASAATSNQAVTEATPPPTQLLPSFPRKGQITYQLTMGSEHTLVGRTVQTWEFDGLQYKLSSRSESTGLVEMFRPHRYIYQSEGRVTVAGLQPERFSASVRRGSRSDESIAVFDWNEQRARIGRLPQQSSVGLPAGSQDVVSFMYQFALFPPQPGRVTLPFTRGTRIDMVSFDVLPAETIDTPLGRLRAVPVIQVRERGAESLAVWLATDYRNLPVRIRFFNRDGEFSGEQLASEIRVAEQ
ncbi:MAG: DUF3108 domain-containing protein [Burkholderiales bacterium]|nr:DUF3108 domain-containing protein [Burkholderiales bacterium]